MIRDYIRRLLWLVIGMVVSSVGITMMLQANIGLEPWSVLQQGMAQSLGISYGTASMIVGAAAILAAVLCGESFGFGTILNIILCAVFIDGLLWLDWIPLIHSLPSGILMLLGGLELLVLGTWMYMKSALGAGPRAHGCAGAQDRPFGRPVPRFGRDHRDYRRLPARRAGRHRHGHLRSRAWLAVQYQFPPAALPRGRAASGKCRGNAPLSAAGQKRAIKEDTQCANAREA